MVFNNFEGKRAVVTGAAGAIGSEICRLLLGEGAEVWALDLQASDIHGVTNCVVDVRDRKGLEDVATRLSVAGSGLDVLVNCHGLQIRASAMTCTDDQLSEIFDVNVGGVLRSCQTFVPLMGDSGSVVNVGSINAIVAARTGAAYGASKAAVHHLTRILALELAPKIRVNGVAPTVVRSGMTADLFENADYLPSKIAAIPMARIAEATDVAAAVLNLAGDSSSFVTGQILSIDGGISLP